jgi:hypothetical protein
MEIVQVQDTIYQVQLADKEAKAREAYEAALVADGLRPSKVIQMMQIYDDNIEKKQFRQNMVMATTTLGQHSVMLQSIGREMIQVNTRLDGIAKWAGGEFAKINQQVSELETTVVTAGQQIRQETKVQIEQATAETKAQLAENKAEMTEIKTMVIDMKKDSFTAKFVNVTAEDCIPIWFAFRHGSQANLGRNLVQPFRSAWRDATINAEPNEIYLLLNINALAVRGKAIYTNSQEENKSLEKIFTQANFTRAFVKIFDARPASTDAEEWKEIETAVTTFMPTWKDPKAHSKSGKGKTRKVNKTADMCKKYIVVKAQRFFEAIKLISRKDFIANLRVKRDAKEEFKSYKKKSGNNQACFNWKAFNTTSDDQEVGPYPVFNKPLFIEGENFNIWCDTIVLANTVLERAAMPQPPQERQHSIGTDFQWRSISADKCYDLADLHDNDEETSSDEEEEVFDAPIPPPKTRAAAKKASKPLPPIPKGVQADDEKHNDKHAANCQCKDCKVARAAAAKPKAKKRKAEDVSPQEPAEKKARTVSSSSSSSSSSSAAADPRPIAAAPIRLPIPLAVPAPAPVPAIIPVAQQPSPSDVAAAAMVAQMQHQSQPMELSDAVVVSPQGSMFHEDDTINILDNPPPQLLLQQVQPLQQQVQPLQQQPFSFYNQDQLQQVQQQPQPASVTRAQYRLMTQQDQVDLFRSELPPNTPQPKL